MKISIEAYALKLNYVILQCSSMLCVAVQVGKVQVLPRPTRLQQVLGHKHAMQEWSSRISCPSHRDRKVSVCGRFLHTNIIVLLCCTLVIDRKTPDL